MSRIAKSAVLAKADPSAMSAAPAAPVTPVTISVKIDTVAAALAVRICRLAAKETGKHDGECLRLVMALLRAPAKPGARATGWQSLSAAFHAVKDVVLHGVEPGIRAGAEREYVRILRAAYRLALEARGQ